MKTKNCKSLCLVILKCIIGILFIIPSTITNAQVISGCTNPIACNYNALAEIDDQSCILPDGCTDPFACNYNPEASCDDQSCILPDGCTDPFACNYNPEASCDDDSCDYGEFSCQFPCSTVFGCTDPLACNYNPDSNCNDGSCEYLNCTIDLELFKSADVDEAPIGTTFSYTITVINQGPSSATSVVVNEILPLEVQYISDFTSTGNYLESIGLWNIDSIPAGESETLEIIVEAVQTSNFFVINTAEIVAVDQQDIDSTPNNNNIEEDDQSRAAIIIDERLGCTNPIACNYDALATNDDGSCVLPDGCTDPTACNYDQSADCDDGSCLQTPICNTDICNGDIEELNPFDPCICISSIVQVLGCTNPAALNYNPTANCDDGSCCLPQNECLLGTIAGLVFLDENGNGVYEQTESGISNILVELIDSGETIESTISNENGEYQFIAILPGLYTVSVGTGPAGSILTNPESYTIDLPEGTFAYYSGFGFSPALTGCTDQSACNFDPLAEFDDESCFYGFQSCPDPCNTTFGCTNINACNYDSNANCDDQSCIQGNLEISVNDIPEIICLGESVALTANVENGTPEYSFEWTIDGQVISNEQSINPSPDTTTIYNVKVTDAIGCEKDTTIEVFVNPFDVYIGGTSSVACENETVEIEAFPVSGVPPFTYEWEIEDEAQRNNKKITVNLTETTVFMVTVRDSTGCPIKKSKKVLLTNSGFYSVPTNELLIKLSAGESIPEILEKLNDDLRDDIKRILQEKVDYIRANPDPSFEISEDSINAILADTIITANDTCDCDGLILVRFPQIEKGQTNTEVDIEALKDSGGISLGPKENVNVNYEFCYCEPIDTTERNNICSLVNADDPILNKIVVGQIDTGIDLPPDIEFIEKSYKCEDGNTVLEGSTVSGIDRFQNSMPLQDSLGHGDHIANIISSHPLDQIKLFSAKIIDRGCSENSSLFDAICSIEKMKDYNDFMESIDNDSDKIRVLNISMGYYGSESHILKMAIENIGGTGTIVVCSAGNEGVDLDEDQDTLFIYKTEGGRKTTTYPVFTNHYPSEFESSNIIVVAAWDYLGDSLTDFSNKGKISVDIVAPGFRIKSKIPYFLDTIAVDDYEVQDGYGVKSGTSMSAAFITRWVARMLSENPAMSVDQVLDEIKSQSEYRPDLALITSIGRCPSFITEKLVCSSSHIKGFAWMDQDLNGIFDSTEVGLDSIEITLTLPNNATFTTYTAGDGYFGFFDLEDDVYTIRVGEGPENTYLATEDRFEIDIPTDDEKHYNFGFAQQTRLDCHDLSLINEFPWLENIIDINNCKGTIINQYSSDKSQFLEIVENGSNLFYREDDSFYCQSNYEFSCIEFYSLKGPIKTWECCENERDTCNALIDYPWIINAIDIENCVNGFVRVYDFETHSYVFISNNNESELYYSDGALICIAGGANELHSYGLYKEDISIECNCGSIVSTIGSLDGLFEKYFWLTDILNPFNCGNELLVEYFQEGAYYIFHSNNFGSYLYNEGGILLCSDNNNYSCLEQFDLTNDINSWSCFSNRLYNNNDFLDLNYSIFPNPNNGNFDVVIPEKAKGTQHIKVYNSTGKLIKIKTVEQDEQIVNISFNLNNIPDGVYFIEFANNYRKVVKRFVKY